MQAPRRIDIRRQSRLFDDFFKIDEVIVSHEQYSGPMSPDQRRLIFERGDSVAVLLLDLDAKKVVLVEQFKVPTLIGRRRDDPSTTNGWIIEAVAGMIDLNETPEEAVIRETMEETGYEIRNPKLIANFFSSPGGTSERIFLYFARVREADKVEKGGGLGDEDIKIVQMTLDDLFERLDNRSIEDPKLIIAAYWLLGNLQSLQDRERLIEGTRPHDRPATLAAQPPSGPLSPFTVRYAIKGRNDLIVGYKTGLIDNITGVSIWVNSENTDMMMDRFIGKTVSARIRYLGANKDDNSNVVEDTIAEELRSAVGQQAHVKIGTVLVTGPGSLRSARQVRQIFHVATVEGGPGTGVKADLANLKQCVQNVLTRADKENLRLWRILQNDLKQCVQTLFNALKRCARNVLAKGVKENGHPWRILRINTSCKKSDLDSILIPMLGCGDGGLPVEEVAQTIISTAVAYLQNAETATLKEIYFLAFKQSDKNACDHVLENFCANGVLVRLEDG